MRCNSELQNLTKNIAVFKRLRPAPAWSALYDLRGLPEQNLAWGGAQRMAHKEAHGKGQSPKEHGTMSIQGYAIRTPAGGIDITTVSPTERAAKVNWLWTACSTTVTVSADDSIIEAAFARHAELAQAQCIPVSVSEVA